MIRDSLRAVCLAERGISVRGKIVGDSIIAVALRSATLRENSRSDQ